MKKSLALLLAVLCVGWLSSGVVADDGRIVELNGVIAAVGDAGIILHTRDGDVRIRVTPDTAIGLNGERVRLGALQRGDRAFVVAQVRRTRDGRILVARSIRAHRDR
ncbi:MAG: hypothetical protein ACF8PN_13135 [Phycisphaerales bacterium]